jgi:exopolysaccharide/PEP-CTERM locus tyrosine autokinase
MGKIFNALEKYKKERSASPETEKLKQSDYEALLQYDRVTGKLDLNDPLFNRDPGIFKRLQTYRLIEADGSLTPAGKEKYAELFSLQPETPLIEPESVPEKEIVKPPPEPAHELREIKASENEVQDMKNLGSKPDPKITVQPVSTVKLEPSDLNVLMQHDGTSRKLDIKIQDKLIVRRLLKSGMIFDGGMLTPRALQLCKELETKNSKQPDKINNNIGEITRIAEKKIKKEPEINPEAVVSIASEAVKAKKESAAVKSPVPKPSMPTSYSKRMDRSLVSLFNPQSFEAEQFKILRSNLLYPVSGSPPRSLMVTSPLPGDGKSFVASNLAISVALNINRHVLLVDCDLRRPSIHTRFGFDDVPGLSDYLLHGMKLQDLLVRTSVDKLTILPGGQPPDNPSELLSSERMSELLNEATERYQDRLIILDSPPPTLTAETSVLARWVEGVVIVVKQGKTPGEGVSDVIDKIGREKIIGGIMNNYEVHSSRYYGKYYGKRSVYNNKRKNA